MWSADTPRHLVGLFPFELVARRYGAKLPVLVGWTHRFAPLGTPLVDRDACADAVAAFLDGKVRFTQIPELITEALERVPNGALDTIESCVEVDVRTRTLVRDWVHAESLAGAAAR